MELARMPVDCLNLIEKITLGRFRLQRETALVMEHDHSTTAGSTEYSTYVVCRAKEGAGEQSTASHGP